MAESGIILDIIQQSKDVNSYKLAMISADNAEVNRGKRFLSPRTTTVLGASSWMDLLLITSTSVITTLTLSANNSGGLAEIDLIEINSSGTTQLTQPAATVSALNRNRLSTVSATLAVYNDSTGPISAITITQGAYLSKIYTGSTGSLLQGGAAAQEDKSISFVLKRGTTYIARVVNLSLAGYASMEIDWSEQ